MTRAALKINIPLYNGIKGSIDSCFYSSEGKYDKRHVYWITPLQTFAPGGGAVYKVKTVPTRARFEGVFTLEVWDNYLQAKPKLVASIKFDVEANTYEVVVTERYMCLRLVSQFNLMRSQLVSETQAFRNDTPYGEWEFKNVI